MEIEQRLGLYQVFLKLYEHHRGLLDEILQLEKIGSKTFSSLATRCVTGVIQGQQVYLVTNLIEGKTQILIQHQGIWTIGRDRQLALPIPDRRLSRRHAVIQYIKNQGFYLVDLHSTNGSFINGEQVRRRFLLKDGDRVRLGSLTFSFLLCKDSQNLDEAPPDILSKLDASTIKSPIATAKPATGMESPLGLENSTGEQLDDASRFPPKPELEESAAEPSKSPLTPAQQSEILDRFFSRQIHNSSQDN